jgi:hypothetical protein
MSDQFWLTKAQLKRIEPDASATCAGEGLQSSRGGGGVSGKLDVSYVRHRLPAQPEVATLEWHVRSTPRDIVGHGGHVRKVPLPDSSTAAIASQFTSRVGVAPQWQPIWQPAESRHACPEMVVVTVRISTLRSREEREALRDGPPEAESR